MYVCSSSRRGVVGAAFSTARKTGVPHAVTNSLSVFARFFFMQSEGILFCSTPLLLPDLIPDTI